MKVVNADKLKSYALRSIHDEKVTDSFRTGVEFTLGLLDAFEIGDAIPVSWLVDKAQERLINREITGTEMTFIKSLIEEWGNE